MASSSSLCFLLSFTVFFFQLSHSAREALQPKGGTTIHLPIRKDATSLQYYTTLELGDRDPSTLNVIRNKINVVVDLGGQFTWFECDKYKSTSYRPIPCWSRKCEVVGGSGCRGCNGPPRPGCTNNTCGSYAYNPFTNILFGEGFNEDVLEVYSTNGFSLSLSNKVPRFPFSCGGPNLANGLAFGTTGMVGLDRSRKSLPTQIARALKLSYPNKFAICIPSSTPDTGLGDIFIGGGSYFMPPYTKDLSKSLAKTPLLINPVSTAPVYTSEDSSDEYFIDVKFIRVDKIRLASFNTSLLTITKTGNGGTKLSTITPYTVLQTSIYKALITTFVKTAASRKIKRVASVSPFGACFDSKTIGNTSTGPDVPAIDLVFGNAVYWRIYGANSMVRVREKGVLCLGFVDGGAKPRTSMVLGGHQLENYLLEFDVSSSMLGFSSSLLVHNTSCSHYRVF